MLNVLRLTHLHWTHGDWRHVSDCIVVSAVFVCNWYS